jgi:hypothetical protein
MSDERKPQTKRRETPEVENLELNKETIQDLTETDAQNVQGGAARVAGGKCTGQYSGCETVPN